MYKVIGTFSYTTDVYEAEHKTYREAFDDAAGNICEDMAVIGYDLDVLFDILQEEKDFHMNKIHFTPNKMSHRGDIIYEIKEM